MRAIVSRLGLVVLFIVGLGFDLSPYQNETFSYVLWAIAAVWLLYMPLPWIRRWRPLTFAPETLEPTDASEGELTAQENRDLLYEALTDRSQDGLVLLEDPDFYEADVIEKRERHTSKLITAALSHDEGMTFLIDDDVSVKGWRTMPLERRVARRMHRLEQLMERVDSSEPLELQPDFDVGSGLASAKAGSISNSCIVPTSTQRLRQSILTT